jgi:multidrug efflux pump subunit AcrB
LPDRIETPVVKEIYNPVFDTEFYYDISPYVEYALGGALNLFFNHVPRGEMWQYGESTSIGVRMELPNGNEISRINGLTKKFEEEILAYRDRIKLVTANVYSEEVAYIRIKFTDQQSRTAFPYMLKNYLIAYATRLGGLDVSVWGYGPGFRSGGGSSSSFRVVAKGFNYVKVKDLAEEFSSVIKGNPRVDNIDINKSSSFRAEDTYEIQGKVERQDLLRANVPIDWLLNSIAKTTRGNISYNKFRIRNEEIDYSIKFDNYNKLQLDELNNTIITTPAGEKLKVKDVIDFKREKVQTAIEREDQQYIRLIAFDYKGPYKYGNKLVESSISNVEIPEGYSISKRQFNFSFGDEEEIQVWIILLMALVLIFMVTSSLFESLKKPSIVLIAIPFAIVGTVFLFYLTDGNIDRGAYAGILLLIGLSVNNSIVLVDYLSNHLNNGNLEKLIELSYKRLRPIFTTTLTTIGALIPLYLGSSTSFWKSLSMSVIGGLLISSLFVVLYVPFLYWRLTGNQKS